MNISAANNQNMGEYLSLLSNPLFLNAVKTAAKSSDSNKKYDGLFANLEKLSGLIAKSNENSDVSASSSPLSLKTDKTTSEAQEKQRMKELQDLGRAADELIARADLMEAMLDLEVTTPDEQLIDLFKKFRDIIAKLDKDTRQLHKDVKDKETKVEYKLRPSSSTKSGFEEGLTLLAK